MRLLLLALMIALLPLRSWVGDVMATEMVLQHSYAAKSIVNDAYSAGAKDHFNVNSEALHTNCHDLAAAVAGTNGPESQADAQHGHCSTCSACQICHTVAVTAMASAVAEFSLPHVLRPADSVRFASTVSTPYLKPPIS